jgi:predicted TPR repeat methyltransferase
VVTGVDLSKQMLEKARNKKLYSRYVHSDILSFLQEEGAHNQSAYDLILCLDTMVYIFDLCPLFSEVRRMLSPSGAFIFSTENTEKEGTILQRSGRYAHSTEDLEKLLHQEGFSVLISERSRLRLDGARWVEGTIWIVTLA